MPGRVRDPGWRATDAGAPAIEPVGQPGARGASEEPSLDAWTLRALRDEAARRGIRGRSRMRRPELVQALRNA